MSDDDIVERLRGHRHMGKLAREAADEIERLRAALGEIVQYPTVIQTEPGWKKIAQRALEGTE